MHSSTSNAARQGAPASVRIQSGQFSGTANLVAYKQVFASLPTRRELQGDPRDAVSSYQVNGIRNLGGKRGTMCLNGAAVLQSPCILRHKNRLLAPFGISRSGPNKGEAGFPIRTVLSGGGGSLTVRGSTGANTAASKSDPVVTVVGNVPSVYDTSETFDERMRGAMRPDLGAQPGGAAIVGTENSGTSTVGMRALINNLRLGRPTANGVVMIERNPQLEWYNDGSAASLATYKSVYNGLNNIKGSSPFQAQVNPIVMNDVHVDYYSQLF